MGKIEIVKQLKSLKSRGKYKEAIERIIGLIDELELDTVNNVKNDLILLQCQFENLNVKQMKGLISFNEGEITENRLIALSLSLINEFETLFEESVSMDFDVDLQRKGKSIVNIQPVIKKEK